MKKEIKIVAIVLVALIVFMSGFGLGASKGITINVGGSLEVKGDAAANANATVPTAQPTTQPTTQPTAPANNDTTTAAPAGNDQPSTAAPSGDNKGGAVPSTNAEIVAAYNKAINDCKAISTGTVELHRVQAIDVKVTDCPGGDSVRKIIDPVVQKMLSNTDVTFTFNNGTDADGHTLNDRVYPGGRQAALTEADIASASAAAEGDGYKITLKIVGEQSTYDGTNTVYPVHHETIMDPLNLATINMDPIKLTSATMDYPGADVELTVDGQGRVTRLYIYMPIDGSGSGGVGFIKATVGVGGSLTDELTFTYA